MSFPANYIAEDDVESFVQNGNVFFNARYLDVNWKYEQLIDFQFNQVVENKVVNTVWTNLGITGGVTAAINTWYPFKSVVLANGNNTILKTYVNGNQILPDVTDSSLPYPTYSGLAFLNFSVDGPFHAGFKDFRVRQYAAAEPAATVGIVTHLSHDATLNTLSISSGTLSPIFTATTTSYTAGVAYGVSSVTVIPTVNQANAIVTVNTVAVTSGQASAALPLTVGANTITVTVIAQDGTTTDTYTITINRAAPAVDATLSNLTISSGTLSPIFTATTTSYTAGVAYSVSSVTVTPTANQANAIITVNTVAVTSGQASAALPLTVGANTITVTVIAQDGITTKTYTITVNRAAPATDATLSNLTIISGSLTPAFAPATTAYADSVAYSVSSVTITPYVNQANATATVNTVAVISGQASGALTLNVGVNTITVTVTAQDGTTTKTYTITVTRTAPAVDAALSNLTISSGSLTPTPFSSATTAYTASVAYSVSSVTVTPTVNQANATVTVNTVAVLSGQASGALTLNVGINTITVTVIAQDGTTTKTYTITVTRAAPAVDATLSNLTISPGSLTPTPFSSATTAYTAGVSVSSVTVTPTVNQANATVTVNTVAVISGQASGALTLNVGVNTITVTVTAQDGTTTKTYTISVTRSAPAVDATLSNLTISSGTLTPAFAAGTINYTDNLAAGVMSVTVTPFVNQINAAVKVNGTTVGSGQPSGILSLIAGANTIAIAVTAQDGVTTKTYTIIVTATAVANGGGGGGGGGVVAGTPVVTGITDVSSYINAKGLFTQNINVWSDDTDALIQIPSGTTVLLANGTMPTQISAIHMPTPPAFQPGAGIIGLAYDFTPAGITFSPAVTLRLSYNPGFLPTGVLENNLQIAYFDTTQNAWITVPATVDTVNHYISAQISHFTAYAVTYGVKQVTPAPTTTTSTTTTTTTVVPVVTTSSTTTTTTAPPTTTTTTTTTVAITTTLPTTTTTTVPVVTTETGTFVSADGKASVMIPSGSLGYTASGAAVTAITVTPVNNPPSVPDDIKGLGLYYEFGPTGATFSSPVSITLKYDPSAVPAGIDQSKLYIAYWDAGNNHWVSVPSVVDTVNHTITASVTHFTLYSAMAAAPSNATSAWVIAAIAVVSLVIIGFGTWIIIYRRRKTA